MRSITSIAVVSAAVWVQALASAAPANPSSSALPSPAERPWPPPGASTNEFAFSGGTLRDFIQAVQNSFGVNLIDRATVPGEYLSEIKVPKIRVAPGERQAINWSAALQVYNALTGNGVRGLGKWVTPAGSDTTVFVPPPPDELDMTKKIRVFAIEAKTESQQNALNGALLSTLDFYQAAGELKLQGQFRYQPSTSLLVAVGDEAYLNAVSEVVRALKETKTAERPKF